MLKKSLFCYFLLTLHLFACNFGSTNLMHNFFDDLEKKVNSEIIIDKFKNAPKEAAFNYFLEHIYKEYNELAKQPKYKSYIDSILNEVESAYDLSTAQHTIIFAFQLKLKDEDIDIHKIAKMAKKVISSELEKGSLK